MLLNVAICEKDKEISILDSPVLNKPAKNQRVLER